MGLLVGGDSEVGGDALRARIAGIHARCSVDRGAAQRAAGYVVVPGQPWLDGFSVGEGLIRQFVALPLGVGDSLEKQLTGRAE